MCSLTVGSSPTVSCSSPGEEIRHLPPPLAPRVLSVTCHFPKIVPDAHLLIAQLLTSFDPRGSRTAAKSGANGQLVRCEI